MVTIPAEAVKMVGIVDSERIKVLVDRDIWDIPPILLFCALRAPLILL
jgi:antitoxin component of MazEF toxin-antitoxin module